MLLKPKKSAIEDLNAMIQGMINKHINMSGKLFSEMSKEEQAKIMRHIEELNKIDLSR